VEPNDIKTTHRPVAPGVRWLGDVKRIALRIARLKSNGSKPRLGSREAVERAAKDFIR
jgi:hypothetical protein